LIELESLPCDYHVSCYFHFQERQSNYLSPFIQLIIFLSIQHINNSLVRHLSFMYILRNFERNILMKQSTQK